MTHTHQEYLHQEYLVTLNVPPSLEEVLVDSLLMLEANMALVVFPSMRIIMKIKACRSPNK